MDFGERLQRAVERGKQRRLATDRQQELALLTEEESKALHAQARVSLADHLEACLKHIADQFPGFDFQTVVTPDGFGAKISRDDLRRRSGRDMAHEYSHLEIIIRSYSSGRLLEIICRGAIGNKEVLSRSFYQPLQQLDLDVFQGQVDQWVLEYAEKFAASGR
ncbi:MAG: hypothetical protein SH850_05230 [Planctomycetaceae bacterium]|nr:hypothetical protein [Planctomycetaceae bacterium]